MRDVRRHFLAGERSEWGNLRSCRPVGGSLGARLPPRYSHRLSAPIRPLVWLPWVVVRRQGVKVGGAATAFGALLTPAPCTSAGLQRVVRPFSIGVELRFVERDPIEPAWIAGRFDGPRDSICVVCKRMRHDRAIGFRRPRSGTEFTISHDPHPISSREATRAVRHRHALVDRRGARFSWPLRSGHSYPCHGS
jgi:hypothetical protein